MKFSGGDNKAVKLQGVSFVGIHTLGSRANELQQRVKVSENEVKSGWFESQHWVLRQWQIPYLCVVRVT